MKIQQPGIFIWVENYEKCVAFYSETLGLPIRMQKENLTNFRFGDGYIILEKGTPAPKTEPAPFVIRLNVADVDAATVNLQAKGIEIKRESFNWAEIGSFKDPDGNSIQLCKFK